MSKQKSLHFVPVLIGLCFFFNPYLAVVDFLPDFIGCLLIALGLFPVSHVHAPMREARRSFFRLAIIDLVKNLMLLFVFGNSSLGEQEVLVLIVAFLSATLGTTFTVIAMRTLFDGFDWIAWSYDCTSLYAPVLGRKSRPELFRHFTVFFIIFKESVLLLPEFASLLNSTYVDSNMIRIYNYIGVMRVLAIIPTLILGIIWLCCLISYFVRLHKQKELFEKLTLQYRSYVSKHPSIRVLTRYTTSFLLIGAGILLLADFYLDFRNILPDPLGGALIVLGILLFGLPKKKLLPALLSGLAYTAISAFSSSKSYAFVSNYSGGDIARSEEAAGAYEAMWLSSLGELACFLVFLFFLLLALRAVLLKWGGYIPEHTVDDFEKRHAQKIHDEFDWQFIKCYIFGFISALVSFSFDYFKTWKNTEKLRYFSRFMEGLWIPDLLLALLFAIYMIYTLFAVMEKIKERFRFE